MKTISESREKLDQAAQVILRQHIVQLLSGKDYVVLGIVGGGSIQGIFRGFTQGVFLPWKKIHLFMLDERLAPLDDPESNYYHAYKVFVAPLVGIQVLPEENLHPFYYQSARHDWGIPAYKSELAKYGGKFDVVILSSGGDGHIASLFPNHSSIKKRGANFIKIEDSPKPPLRRMSASKKLIEMADISLLLFYGESKRHAYKRFIAPVLGIDACPAKLVKKIKYSYVLKDFREL